MRGKWIIVLHQKGKYIRKVTTKIEIFITPVIIVDVNMIYRANIGMKIYSLRVYRISKQCADIFENHNVHVHFPRDSACIYF